MNKLLIALPCAARELEDALHRVCDHAGLWDGRIVITNDKILCVEVKTESSQWCKKCANEDCGARGVDRFVICGDFKTKGETK